MMSNYFPINDNNSRFDLVEIKTTNSCNPTPHCKIHGAMNCVAIHENGKLWRCIQSKDLKDCRAGCEEKLAFNIKELKSIDRNDFDQVNTLVSQIMEDIRETMGEDYDMGMGLIEDYLFDLINPELLDFE